MFGFEDHNPLWSDFSCSGEGFLSRLTGRGGHRDAWDNSIAETDRRDSRDSDDRDRWEEDYEETCVEPEPSEYDKMMKDWIDQKCAEGKEYDIYRELL